MADMGWSGDIRRQEEANESACREAWERCWRNHEGDPLDNDCDKYPCKGCPFGKWTPEMEALVDLYWDWVFDGEKMVCSFYDWKREVYDKRKGEVK